MTDNPERKLDAAAGIRRRKARRRRFLSFAVVLALLALIAVVVSKARQPEDATGNMVTAQVRRTTIMQTVSATGSVTAQTGAQVKIGSQITGRIKQLHADVGSLVHAGQVIAELDLPDIKAQYDQAIANLGAARLRLEQEISGVGMQQTTIASEITKARAGVNTAQAAYDQAVQNAKLQVSTAEAAVREAQANARNMQAQLTRAKQLLDKGWISAQDADNSQTQADVANARLDTAQQNLDLTKSRTKTELSTAQNSLDNSRAILDSARAGRAQNTIKAQAVATARATVKQAQAQVDYWRAQYDKTVIRTPISGTVLALDVQQGETIAAGLSAPTLIRVTDLNRLQVDAFVDETDIGNVHVGQTARVTVDAYPDRVFRGRVTKIASGATMQQNVVTYDTTVAVENTGGLLKPDMTATVELVVGERRDVLAVPTEAVKNQGKAQIVYVKNSQKIEPRPVVTGAADESQTEIVRGLREGQTVVLAGYQPDEGPFGGMRMTPFGPMGRRGGGAPGGGGRGR